MAPERSRSSNGLSHRQFRILLGSFRPAEAAFVLHLAQCERCRGLAARLLAPEAPAPVGDYLGNLSSLERDFIHDLTRGGFLLSLVDRPFARQDDLPPGELQSFLDSLRPEQTAVTRHLLACQNCRDTAAKTLAPSKGQSFPLSSISDSDITA